ncbi:hypothetical protein JMJ77_0011199 [Colletotrichum scovillei]|uniref:Uncharacterized protein n=1 Tax=Colletotrichum scovillei TaxID=1209932 RepID=A0A9P7UB19_9PEZI|nr:hypothetical protein JMJ77_0011199 [Colletotrichum scovillei]KAG7060175.1 hypothetical protein JMJ78_0015450 [Colletotrichum scovillei]KAG7067628.1 hypothetical protein JMJ76_0009056 [Colletotrichum scovillei]
MRISCEAIIITTIVIVTRDGQPRSPTTSQSRSARLGMAGYRGTLLHASSFPCFIRAHSN